MSITKVAVLGLLAISAFGEVTQLGPSVKTCLSNQQPPSHQDQHQVPACQVHGDRRPRAAVGLKARFGSKD